MSLRLNNREEVPPGGFRYRVPTHDRILITGPSWIDLVANVRKFYRANDLLIPDDLSGLIELQLCEQMPKETCRNDDPVEDAKRRSIGSVSFQKAWDFTKMMGEWLVRYGGKLVSMEESEKRAEICATSGSYRSACIYNRPIECSSCTMSKLVELTALLVGPGKTTYDNELKACAVCGCNLKAKIRMPKELLDDYTGPDVNVALPDYCWAKKA